MDKNTVKNKTERSERNTDTDVPCLIAQMTRFDVRI